MASSSVEKNVVGSLCAGRSAKKKTQTQANASAASVTPQPRWRR